MAQLVAQAGLTLNAGQMADLALAWRQIIGLIARIPRERPLLDDQAYVFRLPPPEPAVKPGIVRTKRQAAAKTPAAAKAKVKAAAKAKPLAKKKAQAKAPARPRAGQTTSRRA